MPESNVISPEDELRDKAAASSTSKEKLPEKTPEQALIDDLQGKLDESQKRLTEAEIQRDAERAQKDSARKAASEEAARHAGAREQAVSSTLLAAKTALESAEKEYIDAEDSGDTKRKLAAQKKLNDAQIDLRGAVYAEEQFKREKKVVPATPSTTRYSPKTQAWIDSHPRYTTDKRYQAAAWAADEDARSKGYAADTDGYFDYVNEWLSEAGFEDGALPSKKNEERTSKTVDTKIKKENKTSTAAPPGGSTGGSSGSRSEDLVTLTAEQQEMAQLTWPDEYRKDPKGTFEKYARHLTEMKNNPRFNARR